MTEIIGFSPAENDEIGKTAIEVAKLGEECVWDLVLNSLELKKLKAILIRSCPQKTLEIKKWLDHEIAVIEEVTQRARPLMQIFGTDDFSKMDRIYKEKGLGSLFDPESEASKILRLNNA